MTWYFISLCLLSLLYPIQAARASTYADTREAVAAYDQKKYEDSLSRFQQVLVASPDDPQARFNLASAQYQTGNFPEAAKGFEEVLSRSNDPALKQKALYNLGNTAFRQGDLRASADYYRKALDLSPSDADAKQNLEFVLKELDQQQQQKKGGQNQKGDEKNKEQQRTGEQNKQKGADHNQRQAPDQKQQATQARQKDRQEKQSSSSQTPPDKEKQDGSDELKDAGAQEGQKQGGGHEAARAAAKPDPKALAPDEAERLLNSLSDDQRAFLKEQAKRFAPGAGATSKDW